MHRSKQILLAVAAFAVAVIVPRFADAFCGFYVSDANDALYNNATRVSLLRHQDETVMAMQNNYEGPAQDFAMVVPVPVVLKKKRVKTLDDGVFDRLDEYTAPRLVEYWEQDPCKRRVYDDESVQFSRGPQAAAATGAAPKKREKVVTVEAEFKVGEYDIVILSSEESTALESWLRNHEYNIPKGAAPYLKPYVQKGMYFFVARVDMDKVRYRDGEAVLSPLRFHYESDAFKLPVRLGLINSKGSQDLIVYTISPNHRYKVANYPNVTIPTNIKVDRSVKRNFGGFYRELFNRVVEEQPKAVVTEYSWRAGSCDPCPKAPLSKKDLTTLGADVVAPTKTVYERTGPVDPFAGRSPKGKKQSRERKKKVVRIVRPGDWVVTRLHTKYDEETLGRDLVFTEAKPIRGGRGMPEGDDGRLPEGGAERSSRNNFQGRYVILHHWEGDVDCEHPRRGIWGGRGGRDRAAASSAASDVGFSSAKPVSLSEVVEQTEISGLSQPVETYDESTSESSSSQEGATEKE